MHARTAASLPPYASRNVSSASFLQLHNRCQMSDGRYGVLQGGGHIADSSLGHQGDNQVPQSAPAQPLTVPTHSRTVRETPLSRRLVGVADLYKGRGIESSVAAKDSAGSLEVSLMARGPPMTFNPKVVDDLSRENTRLKVELMRIGQGGRMLPIEQTLVSEIYSVSP